MAPYERPRRRSGVRSKAASVAGVQGALFCLAPPVPVWHPLRGGRATAAPHLPHHLPQLVVVVGPRWREGRGPGRSPGCSPPQWSFALLDALISV